MLIKPDGLSLIGRAHRIQFLHEFTFVIDERPRRHFIGVAQYVIGKRRRLMKRFSEIQVLGNLKESFFRPALKDLLGPG